VGNGAEAPGALPATGLDRLSRSQESGEQARDARCGLSAMLLTWQALRRIGLGAMIVVGENVRTLGWRRRR